MYKFNLFNDLTNIIRHQISPIIKGNIEQQNLTKSEISANCKELQDSYIKEKFEALLLFYMYLFIDKANSYVNAGDLATGPYPTELTRGDFSNPASTYYVPTHNLVTNMYNDMVNGSLPLSVLEFPDFFVLKDKFFPWDDGYAQILNNNRIIELIEIPVDEFRKYHFLWRTYNQYKTNFTLICINDDHTNCSVEPVDFQIVDNSFLERYAENIREHPNRGILLEGEAKGPPCNNPKTVEEFKINSICNFLKNVSSNKDAFLKLMKFTKQSPVFLDDDDEYLSVFASLFGSSFGHGYTFKKNKV